MPLGAYALPGISRLMDTQMVIFIMFYSHIFSCLGHTPQVLDHPHVYAVADKAHRFMTDPSAGRLSGGVAGSRKRDQSIIITGESGAGKTEAAK